MFRTKFPGVLLLALLTLTLCAACAAESADAPGADMESAPTTAPVVTAEAQSPGVNAPPPVGVADIPLGEGDTPAPDLSGELTVACWADFDEEFLRDAAAILTERYPGVTVTFRFFREYNVRTGADGSETSDAVSEDTGQEDWAVYMNTRLMSGDAEDVIFTQELTMRRYTEMGAFEDLSPYLAASPEIGPDTHHMTPLELMRGADEAVYELPLSWNTGEIVSFDAALVREAGIAPPEGDSLRYRDALQYAQKLVDGSTLPNTYLALGSGWEMTSRLLYDDFPSFLDYDRRTADFGGQRFIALLEEGKRWAEEGYFMSAAADFDFYNTEYHLALGVGGGGVGEAYWALAPEATGHRSVGHRPLADAQGRVAMTASDLVGLNSQSEQKALAWAFLEVLLSERAQTLPSFRGLGVHRAGFDAAVRRETEYLNGLNGLNTDPDAVAELLGGWMAQINHFARPENAVEGGRDSFLMQALDGYFHQGLDAATTARQLQAQVDKYLNE